MTEAEFFAICETAVLNAYWKVYNAAPKDTWNLAVNALKLEKTTEGWRIYVDPAIAPYMVYTEEPWTSPFWEGKKNPNEGWFKNVTADVAEYIARTINGTVEEGTENEF